MHKQPLSVCKCSSMIGVFKYVNDVSYLSSSSPHWATNQPSNSDSGEDCAAITTSQLLNDAACTTGYYYICEEDLCKYINDFLFMGANADVISALFLFFSLDG